MSLEGVLDVVASPAVAEGLADIDDVSGATALGSEGTLVSLMLADDLRLRAVQCHEHTQHVAVFGGAGL